MKGPVSSTPHERTELVREGGNALVRQGGHLSEKLHTLLYPCFLTHSILSSSRQEVQKHKGNRCESCERLLINQHTPTL